MWRNWIIGRAFIPKKEKKKKRSADFWIHIDIQSQKGYLKSPKLVRHHVIWHIFHVGHHKSLIQSKKIIMYWNHSKLCKNSDTSKSTHQVVSSSTTRLYTFFSILLKSYYTNNMQLKPEPASMLNNHVEQNYRTLHFVFFFKNFGNTTNRVK